VYVKASVQQEYIFDTHVSGLKEFENSPCEFVTMMIKGQQKHV
jgi:hypothetical protein